MRRTLLLIFVLTAQVVPQIIRDVPPKVQFLGPPIPATNMAATITVDQGTSYQTIKGWEFTGNIGNMEFPASFPNWDTEIISALVDLGMNRVRTEILSGLTENTTDHYQAFIDNDEDVIDDSTPSEWATVRANRRIPVNDNSDPNSINASGFQWGYIDRQVDTVVLPMKAALEDQGETLFWTVCYVHFSTSNQLHVDDPDEFGELVLALWQHLDSKYGFVPGGLEPFLEPDNGSAQVTASEIAAMIAAARNRLVGGGFAKPYIVAPSLLDGRNAEDFYDDIKTANATAAGYIDEISYHRYATPPNTTQLANLRTKALADGKNTAMTEFIGYTTGDLFEDLRYARVSAAHQFVGAYPSWAPFVTDDGAQLFLIGDSPGYAVTMGERTKYLRQYFKYVRAGAVMKGSTDSSGSYQSAVFENANGTYAVVVRCAGSQDLTIEGLPAGEYEIRYTLGNGSSAPSAYDQSISNQTIGEGEDIVFNMPGAGIVTIFDTNYMGTPEPPPAEGVTYYAATDGTPGGDGSIGDPWDLRTALNNASWEMGDILYLRGGAYFGRFTPTINLDGLIADVDKPRIMSYPGERAVIDANVTTTLSGSIDDTDSTISFASTADLEVGRSVVIDDEIMLIGIIHNANDVTVNRAWDGSDGAAHSDGATVRISGPVFQLTDAGSNTIWENIDVTCTATLRDQEADQQARAYPVGFSVTGSVDGAVFRNLRLYDLSLGFFTGGDTSNTKIQKNHGWNIGLYLYDPNTPEVLPDWAGMFAYLENGSGTSVSEDNLVVNNVAGFQLYGVSAAFVGGQLRRNIIANNGSLMGNTEGLETKRFANILAGTNISVSPTFIAEGNLMYQPPGVIGSPNFQLGYSAGITEATLNDNIIVGGKQTLSIGAVTTLNGDGNHVANDDPFDSVQGFVGATPPSGGDFGRGTGNTYHNSGSFSFGQQGTGYGDFSDWQGWLADLDDASTATGAVMPDTVVVNPLGDGRAFVAAFLASGPSTFDIDLSEVTGLNDGDPYTIYNGFDRNGGAVHSATYNEGDPIVTLPMSSFEAVAAPTGLGFTPATTAPYFAAAVIEPGASVVPVTISRAGMRLLLLN